MIQIPDEEVNRGVYDYIVANIGSFIEEMNQQISDGNILRPFKQMNDDYLDPSHMDRFPQLNVFTTQSKDDVETRALDRNHAIVRVMIVDMGTGGLARAMRYHALILEMTKRDRTFETESYGRLGRVRVMERVYYTPITPGDQEYRVSETYLEVYQEVQRR